MAVTYFTPTILESGGTFPSPTFAYTMQNGTSGTKRKLVFFIAASFRTVISSINYNGVALVAGTSLQSPGSGLSKVWTYYLDDASLPTDGLSHNLVVNFSAGSDVNTIAILYELAGVNAGAPSSNPQNPGTSTGPNLTFTTATNGAPLLHFLATLENCTITAVPGGGTVDATMDSAAFGRVAAHHTVGPNPAAAGTYAWTTSASTHWDYLVMELIDSAAPVFVFPTGVEIALEMGAAPILGVPVTVTPTGVEVLVETDSMSGVTTSLIAYPVGVEIALEMGVPTLVGAVGGGSALTVTYLRDRRHGAPRRRRFI